MGPKNVNGDIYSHKVMVAELMGGWGVVVNINRVFTTCCPALGLTCPSMLRLGDGPKWQVHSQVRFQIPVVASERAPTDHFHLFLVPTLFLHSLAGYDSIILSDSFQHSLLLF